MEQLKGWLADAYGIALGWLTSPAALSQIALLILAYLAARLLARRFSPVIERTVTPKPEAAHVIARLRRFALLFLPLLLYALSKRRLRQFHWRQERCRH